MRFIVILDNLRSAHNVGSIFRTADALGCEKIYLCGTTPTPSGASLSVTLKAALGAEKNIPWEYKKRISDPLKFLKKQNFQIIALEQDKNAIDIRRLKVKASGKIALVLGYEVKGVSKSVLKQCDKITEIPMFGKKESLNVAVAFGIAGYWIKFSERKE